MTAIGMRKPSDAKNGSLCQYMAGANGSDCAIACQWGASDAVGIEGQAAQADGQLKADTRAEAGDRSFLPIRFSREPPSRF